MTGTQIRTFAAGYALGAIGLVGGATLLAAPQTKSTSLTPVTLERTLKQMGYEVTEVTPGYYELKTSSTNMLVYVVANVSKSGRSIWLTVNLGELTEADQKDPAKLLSLLKRNTELQPTHFFVTAKNNLRLGIPVENENLAAADLRKAIEDLRDDVYATRDLWIPKPVAKKNTEEVRLSNP
ncbi:MAG: hypothetical protein JNM85_10445 [Chthonomonas sp.]|nr:hypothetical protein [Chthonomonas sp.]